MLHLEFTPWSSLLSSTYAPLNLRCFCQGLALLFCALGPEELSKVRLGPLTPHAVRTLRHLKAFFGVTFNVRPEAASRTIFLSCIGAGLRNASRRLT